MPENLEPLPVYDTQPINDTSVDDVQQSTVIPPPQEVTYPTAPDADGFYTESADDQLLDIQTKVYDNGNKIKKTILKSINKTAVVRELIAKETKDIQRYMGKDEEKYMTAGVCVSTSIDGAKETFEFFETMKMKDSNKLISMFQDLNF